jgi:uncharacterized membrane protein YedE/YeeE
MIKNLKYIIVGTLFGIIAIKSEVVSWFRIQEMFRFNNFHMYGVVGTAVVVGIISIQLIKRLNIKTLLGNEIKITPKKFHKGQVFGGLIFGLGWVLTSACFGPLFALIGAGFGVVFVMFLSALLGTWVYGYFREKLPH